MMEILLALALDLLVGDPENLPHPVRFMGRIINWEEGLARKVFTSPRGLKFAGLLMVVINVFLAVFLPGILLYFLAFLSLDKVFSTYLIFSCLAARNLRDEAMKVYRDLDQGLDEARYRLSFIVGRDTKELDEAGIIRATVETVSENTSDGIIAPLFYILLFGPIGGLVYKFINTMDSMVAYKNEKYENLGYFPALVDDLVNFLPARLSAALMLVSSLGRYSVIRAFRVIIRDRKKHESPNAIYPEAAVAGLLGVELGGGSYYKGTYVDKPTIGDGLRGIESQDIKRSIEIMFTSEFLLVLIYLLINLLRS